MNASPALASSSRAFAVRIACAGAFLVQGLDYLPRCIPASRSTPIWFILIPLIICFAYTAAGLHLFRNGTHAVSIAFVLLAINAALTFAMPHILAPRRLPPEFLDGYFRQTRYVTAAALLPIAAQAIALLYVRSNTTGNAKPS